jgi:hypothetical protein
LLSLASFYKIRISQRLYEDQIATAEIDIDFGTMIPFTQGLVEF